jgi:hypothetical protein
VIFLPPEAIGAVMEITKPRGVEPARRRDALREPDAENLDVRFVETEP